MEFRCCGARFRGDGDRRRRNCIRHRQRRHRRNVATAPPSGSGRVCSRGAVAVGDGIAVGVSCGAGSAFDHGFFAMPFLAFGWLLKNAKEPAVTQSSRLAASAHGHPRGFARRVVSGRLCRFCQRLRFGATAGGPAWLRSRRRRRGSDPGENLRLQIGRRGCSRQGANADAVGFEFRVQCAGFSRAFEQSLEGAGLRRGQFPVHGGGNQFCLGSGQHGRLPQSLRRTRRG